MLVPRTELGRDRLRPREQELLSFAGDCHFNVLDGTEGGYPPFVFKLSLVEISGKDHELLLTSFCDCYNIRRNYERSNVKFS